MAKDKKRFFNELSWYDCVGRALLTAFEALGCAIR